MPSFWSRKGLFNFLLLPFSLLFGFIAGLRRTLYAHGLLPSRHPGVPTIVVGNITAGGSGKTPFVIWLAGWLRTQGYRPGVVSRGYGRKCSDTLVVERHSRAADVGDEPLLIRQSGVPVAVASRRLAACAALRHAYPEIDVLIADDGLQHYAMQRDLELVLADARAQFGNGWLLPAGPLREPVSRLVRADALILSRRDAAEERLPSSLVPVFAVQHIAGLFRNLLDPEREVGAAHFSDREVDAVAGIARPQAFFDSLEQTGLRIRKRAFPDHHHFVSGDLDSAACVVMTAKDAVKCRELAGPDWWVRELELHPDPVLVSWLKSQLERLGTRYGS